MPITDASTVDLVEELQSFTASAGDAANTTLSLDNEYEFVMTEVRTIPDAPERLPNWDASVTGFQTGPTGNITGVNIVYDNDTTLQQTLEIRVVGRLA